LSNTHPSNLFLAIRAARLTIDAKDKNATTFVQRTFDLAKAIEPSLNETTRPIGLTPLELVNEIKTAIENKKWEQANSRMLQWFNVLNPTEILKTDRRRASPHPLDRLSFETLRRLSAKAIKKSPLKQGDAEIQFTTKTIDEANAIVDAIAIDFDLDLDDDIATVSQSGAVQLWQNDANNWKIAGSIQLASQPTGLIVADLFMVDSSDPNRIKSDAKSGATDQRDYSTEAAHDTFPSLVAFGDQGLELYGIDGRSKTPANERLVSVTKKSGLEDVSGAIDIVTGDLEGDGDLDLVVATQNDGIRLFVNRGNRTFFEVQYDRSDAEKSDPASSLAVVDIDRDLDLDIVSVHASSGRVRLLENQLHLQFRSRLIDDIPAVAGASSIAVAEIDGNVSWDLVIGGKDDAAIVFSQTAEAGIWTVESVKPFDLPAPNLALADLDNDSWSECLVAGGLSRLGPWGASDKQALDFLSKATDIVSLANLDGDGRVDLIAAVDGNLVVATNETQTENHHLTVRFKGIADNNANSGRVNHYGIGSVLELRFGPHYRSQVITSPATHFGLDGFGQASSIRVIMPNGLTQTIREPKVDALVQEQQTLKGSCPYLYAWDGQKFAFVTDCLWAAPLGLQVARGVVAKDRPWEYLKVNGDLIRPVDGRYRLRITEELWEVAYFDHLALTAVDHPKEVDVWTNEKVGPPQIAKQTIFAFGENDQHLLRHATDTKGRDITELLRFQDRQFVKAFDRRMRQGLCEPHWIDLDFKDVSFSGEGTESVYLVLTGWILPTDTSLNIQIDQNPTLPPIEFPSVWVPDSDKADGWRKAIPFMGFPGGKTKTIVVDVTDTIVQNDPRLRVRTSAQIYWDDASLVIQSDKPSIVTHELPLLNATVDYHGFSKRIRDDERQPEVYDYQQASVAPKWPPLRGTLTEFGPCQDLLGEWDDSMVVISSGDEIQVDFAVPTAPIPEGWERDFVLHCVGWDKDADLNTLEGQTIDPLPFREMQSYPPRVDTLAQARKVAHANASHRHRRQSFRSFWHRPGQRGTETTRANFRGNSLAEIRSLQRASDL
jgi:hypothetical protein